MARRLASNLTDDYLTCSICCNLFVNPRQTPCEHTFCLKCLNDYGSRCKGREFVCPLCRTVSEIEGRCISEWIEALPPDRFLVAIMETVNNYQTLQLADESETVENSDKSKSQTCSKHNDKALNIYCTNHDDVICFECAWQKHASCECVSLKKESVEQRLVRTREVINDRLVNFRTIQERQNTVQQVFEKDKSEAMLQVEDIQNRLQLFWGKLQMNIQKIFEQALSASKDVSDRKTFIDSELASLQKLKDRLDNSAGCTAVELHSLITETEKEIDNIENSLAKLGGNLMPCHLKFTPDRELLQVLDKCREIGALIHQTEGFHSESNTEDDTCLKATYDDDDEFEQIINRRKIPCDRQSSSPQRILPLMQSDFHSRKGNQTHNKNRDHRSTGRETTQEPFPEPTEFVLQTEKHIEPSKGSKTHKVKSDQLSPLSSFQVTKETAAAPLSDVSRDISKGGKPYAFLERTVSPDSLMISKSDESPCAQVPVSVHPSDDVITGSETPNTDKILMHRPIGTREQRKETATLSGISTVENHVIVVDQYNNCIMKYSIESGNCDGTLTVQEPHKVSLIPRTADVLLTCWDHNVIHVISTELELKITGEVKTERNYIGVCAVDQNRILVTATDRAIDLISFKGHVLLTINPNRNKPITNFLYGQYVLLPADIGFVGDDNIIVHDGMKKSLICVSLAGKVRWCRRISGLTAMRCYKNAIYVSVGKFNMVIKLNSEGKTVDEKFLPQNLGIKRPWALDIVHNIMVVTEDSPSSKFHLLKLNV